MAHRSEELPAPVVAAGAFHLDDDPYVRIGVGRAPVHLPGPIDTVARTVVAIRKGHATIGSTAPSRWLFPCGQPGRPSAPHGSSSGRTSRHSDSSDI